jgi:hypothetical protein
MSRRSLSTHAWGVAEGLVGLSVPSVVLTGFPGEAVDLGRLAAVCPPCHTGSSTTTTRDRTARSEGYRRSAAFTTCVGRTAREGRVEKAFSPVTHAGRSAAQVIAWMQMRGL